MAPQQYYIVEWGKALWDMLLFENRAGYVWKCDSVLLGKAVYALLQ